MSHVLAIDLHRSAYDIIVVGLGPGAAIVEVDAAEAVRRVKADGASVDVVIVGEAAPKPLHTARRLLRLAPAVPVLVVADAAHYEAVARARERAAAAGEDVHCVRAEEPEVVADTVRALIATSRRRRSRIGSPAPEAAGPPLRDTAAPAQTLAALRDALHARDELLSLASHELKTPLTPLKLQVQILSRKAASLARDAGARKLLEQRLTIIQRQVDRLTTLVTDLLDVSRIAEGRLALSNGPVDLSEVTRGVLARLRDSGEIERAGATVAVHAPRSAVGLWDRTRLDQMVSNLLQDALKSGPGHAVDVAVSAGEERAEIRIVSRSVDARSDGEERIEERILAGFRAPAAGGADGGFGMGVYVARAIAELLGGGVAVGSSPRGDAVFTVTLPLEPVS